MSGRDDTEGDVSRRDGPRQKSTWMEISPEAQAQLKGERLKKKIPIFDMNTMADDIKSWLADVETFCCNNGITNDEVKISIAMDSMNYHTRELMASVLPSARRVSWKKFKVEILE